MTFHSDKPTRARALAVVVMAAGQGKRMKDPNQAKVMYELDGKPMLHYVVDLADNIGAGRVIAVIGHQREEVMKYLERSHPHVVCVVQAQQLGTGHAVMQAQAALKEFVGDVLVLSGDVPLLTSATMQQLFECHVKTGAGATILTAKVDDPSGYGRLIRNGKGFVERIVEHRDASEQELEVREINSGIYLFNKETLFDGLAHINTQNSQHEYYLTDVFEYFWKNHKQVSALMAPHPDEIHGINTPEQLEQARRILEQRETESTS